MNLPKLRLLSLGMVAAVFVMPAFAAPRNVVFILADDLGYGELGCYGQDKIRTPHLDQLAAEGMRFTHHYSGAPVCAPARCVLLTGKHLGHAEIRGNRQAQLSFPEYKEGQHPLSAEAFTLAEAFQGAGFATAAMGKWGLGPVGSTGDPNKQGFEWFFGYNCQAVAHSFYPRFLWRNDKRIEINAKPIPGHARQAEGTVKMEDWIGRTYASIPIRDEALAFIRRHKDKPFFLYLPFTEPHAAMHPPVESVNAYPAGWDDVPYRGQNAYLPHPRPRAAYAAMISDLDRHVGDVVSELKRAGILDETLIVFTSDNGTTHRGADPADRFGIAGVDAAFFNSTAGLRGFKGSVYEGGLRVPMIMRLPGVIAQGATHDTPSYFADWFPTLCAAFGVEVPVDLDGENLWPVITGEKTPGPRMKPMLWVYPEYGGQVAVRLGTMKVVRQQLATRKPGPWEVYDISKDPGETRNIAAEHPAVIQEAVNVLRREMSDNPLFPLTVPGLDAR